MNSKNILLLGLCIIGLCAWEAQAVNLNHSSIINVEDNLPTDFETFELHGDLLLGVGRNAVCVHFSQSFGNVSVALHNEDGVLVYSTVVNTDVQQTLIIPLANNSGNGGYYLTLDNATGFAEGDFRKN